MDPTNANTALASAFVEELARGGVRHAVISPGSRSTPLALALWRRAEIEVTVIVDERSAGFFALGAAQASGDPVALLCTSGTAAANYHPAVCEADESGLPLVVLTADRPPELRGIGAGQTVDQIKLFGSSVRWFCEVGTHAADDDGLLHYRSVACRALASARGETRPGPVHLNLPWREPLAPVAVEGAVTATDPLALEGRGGRPLTAVTRIDLEPSVFLLDEVAGHIAEAISGVIIAGRQLDPELREPLVHLARASGFPILAEPTSQLRCGPHDRSHVISTYDLLLRDEHFARSVVPDLVLRFGEMPTSKPLRAWLAAQRRRPDPRRSLRRLERAEPPGRSAAESRPDRARLRLGDSTGERRAWSAGEVDRRRRPRPTPRSRMRSTPRDRSTEPALHLALGRAHRDGDLVYTASSMPIRDQEAFLPLREADALFLCNRGANGIDGLISSGIGAAHASGRPTTIVTGELGLLHDLGGLAALHEVATPVRIVVIDNGGGGIFHFLPQESAMAPRSLRPCSAPRGFDLTRAAALFGLPHHRLDSLDNLPGALAAGTGLIEVRTDRRTNVEAHRRSLAEAASASPRPA